MEPHFWRSVLVHCHVRLPRDGFFDLLGRLLELGTASSQVIIKSPPFFLVAHGEPGSLSRRGTNLRCCDSITNWECELRAERGKRERGRSRRMLKDSGTSSLWQRVSTPAVGLLQVLVNNQENYGSIFPPNWTWHQQGFMMICDDCT